jgi:Uncharacterized conserved protein, COG2968
MGQTRNVCWWLGVLAVSLWAGMSPAWAEKRDRVLQVTGQAIITVPAQLAEVELGVEIRGNNANQVQTEIAQRMDRIIATCGKKLRKN